MTRRLRVSGSVANQVSRRHPGAPVWGGHKAPLQRQLGNHVLDQTLMLPDLLILFRRSFCFLLQATVYRVGFSVSDLGFSVGFGPPRRHELPKLEVGRWKGTSVKNVACRDPVSLVYPSWQTGNYAEAGTLPELKAATVY